MSRSCWYRHDWHEVSRAVIEGRGTPALTFTAADLLSVIEKWDEISSARTSIEFKCRSCGAVKEILLKGRHES